MMGSDKVVLEWRAGRLRERQAPKTGSPGWEDDTAGGECVGVLGREGEKDAREKGDL